jgi:hypothetical protein
MDGNEIVTRNYDYKTGGTVKGINLLTAFYNSEKAGQGIRLPIGFRIVAKTGEYTDDTGGEKKRKSPQTKNRMMQEMIRSHLQNQVPLRYILADSWYSSAENMRFINKRWKVFIFELKDNRKVPGSEMKRNPGQFERLDQMKLPEEKPMKVRIKDLGFPVIVFRQVFRNKDGTAGERFPATNDLSLIRGPVENALQETAGCGRISQKFKTECVNREFAGTPGRTRSNHIFAAIYGYVKPEMLKHATGHNHFALKTKMYMASIRTAMLVFQKLWENTQSLAFV